MRREITLEMIEAMRDGSAAMINQADGLERLPEYGAENSVGVILRNNVEVLRGRSALIRDFISRFELDTKR